MLHYFFLLHILAEVLRQNFHRNRRRIPPAPARYVSTIMMARTSLKSLLLLSILTVACAKGDTTAEENAASFEQSQANGPSPADSAEEANRPALALPVTAQLARDGDLIMHVNTTGQVRSDAVVQLRSAVEGTVQQILVRPGARVARGTTLLQFDPYPFDLAVREAKAKVDEAEQRYLESFLPESLVTGIGPTAQARVALMNRAGLAGARLALERVEFQKKNAVITSPVNGIVDAVAVAPGERLGAGSQLFTIVDTRNIRIEAQVLEHDLPNIRVGGEAKVTSAGAPGRTIRGRVDAILPLVDSITRAGRAVIRVNGDGTLRPGMYADVQLESARLLNRRLVPTRAIIERDGRPLVFVVKDGRAQWTYIVPGMSNGEETEVLPDSGSNVIPINAGDEIIVEGHLTLTHDAAVKVSVPGKNVSLYDLRRYRSRSRPMRNAETVLVALR